MSISKLLRLFSYNIIVVILLFLFSEIFTRIFFNDIQTVGTSKNLLTDSLYYDSPGLVRDSKGSSNGITKSVNSFGFWKYSNERIRKRRILYLGDSVTMGVGVESDSTFAGIINNRFDSLTIFNPSLIGYSHVDYYNIIRSLMNDQKNQLKISEVYLFWCLNDLYSTHPNLDSPELQSNGIIFNVINFFRTQSKFYHLLKNLFFDRPESYYLYDSQFYVSSNTYFENAINSIKQINNILVDMNINFTIILLPYEYQMRPGFESHKTPQNLLIQKFLENDINVYDFTPNLKVIDLGEKDLYLYGDGIHFSKFGNKIIARILTDILRKP